MLKDLRNNYLTYRDFTEEAHTIENLYRGIDFSMLGETRKKDALIAEAEMSATLDGLTVVPQDVENRLAGEHSVSFGDVEIGTTATVNLLEVYKNFKDKPLSATMLCEASMQLAHSGNIPVNVDSEYLNSLLFYLGVSDEPAPVKAAVAHFYIQYTMMFEEVCDRMARFVLNKVLYDAGYTDVFDLSLSLSLSRCAFSYGGSLMDAKNSDTGIVDLSQSISITLSALKAAFSMEDETMSFSCESAFVNWASGLDNGFTLEDACERWHFPKSVIEERIVRLLSRGTLEAVEDDDSERYRVR